jgi:alpha-1,3-mannosyltransferase
VKLRVLHVTRQFVPSVGGIQNVVAALAREQHSRGHQVSVATLARSQRDGAPLGPPTELLDGIHVTRLRHWGPRQYSIAPAVGRLLRGQDLIHVHSMDFFCDYLACLRAWHRVPMVLTTHGLYFHSGDQLGLKRLYLRTVTRLSLRAYRRVVAVSEADRQRLAGVARDVVVIPNGVDAAWFARVRRRTSCPTLLAIGVSAPHKRPELLVAAQQSLRAALPDARIILTGGPPGSTAPGVEWRGVVSEDELRELLAQASMVCSASDYEGFGTAVLEAMAAGVPCAVRLEHPLAAFAEQGALFTVDFHRPDLAAMQLRALLCDQDRLSETAQRGRKLAARYSWRAVADHYEQVYRWAAPPP